MLPILKTHRMKKNILCLLCCFVASALPAQEVRLNDSVIFINNKPVALYAKTLNNSPQRYNMEVYSFDDYVLIKAEVIEFTPPVGELNPFFYYELSFPPTGDTFDIYIEDEAFPLVLAKIINDYNLINKNELNKKNVARLISNYSGGPALAAKIKSVIDYLDETRHFKEQVLRDRTKPVTIINDRIIMQDGVKIGLIAAFEKSEVSNKPMSVVSDTTKFGTPIYEITDYEVATKTTVDIFFANGRKIDGFSYRHVSQSRSKKASANKSKQTKSLYEVSKSKIKRISLYTDNLLMMVCFLIEDYSL